jgi:hypothetical protein
MNKIIDCLTKNQVELYKAHIDYLISNNLVNRTASDASFPNACEFYGDPPTEILLHYLQPKIEKEYGKELVPTYSFWRAYFEGQDCFAHTDRPACEVSLTLNVGGKGGDDWAFYAEGKRYILGVGQALMYKGIEQKHWRNKLTYERHYQIFLHWIERNGKHYPQCRYDGRTHLYG